MKIILFSKPNCPISWGVMQGIRAQAVMLGMEVACNYDDWTAAPLNEASVPASDARNYDMAIAVGGDGTMLGMVRSLFGSEVPVIGVNLGTLGYMTEVAAAQAHTMLKELAEGRYAIENRILLEAQQGDGVQALAVNDVVFHGQGRLVAYDVFMDGKAVFSLRADGLIITTPTGSTAYALSANGPIMHPGLEALALVPINPHSLTARPITLPSTASLTVTVRGRYGSRLDCDGQSQGMLEDGQQVTIRKARQTFPMVHLETYDLFNTLREKLDWGSPRKD